MSQHYAPFAVQTPAVPDAEQNPRRQSLVTQIRAKLEIQAHRPVRSLLDGNYRSVLKGRSIDFDDLRPYQFGDDVKDIDWRATSRSGHLLVKRYAAERNHRLLLVVDSGRSMAAVSRDGDPKSNISITAAGVLGYIAIKHGDRVGLVCGDAEKTEMLPIKSGLSHLEQILITVKNRTTLDSPGSDIWGVLRWVARHVGQRLMVIVIAGEEAYTEFDSELLKRMLVQHELLWVTVNEVDPTAHLWSDKELYDVEAPTVLPEFLRNSDELRQQFVHLLTSQKAHADKEFDRLGISWVDISSDQEAVRKIIYLLETQKHARRY